MAEDNNSAPEVTQEPTPEPPQSSGFDLGVVIEQAKLIVTDPRAFYSNMPKTGGFSEPLIFLLVMAVASGTILTLFSIIGIKAAGFGGIGSLILMPIAMTIAGFIGAAILFIVWKLMGSEHSYETAYRCLAYSTAILPVIALLSIVPYLGTAVRIVWSIWLVIIASTTVHGRSEQSSRVVFGILGALMLVSGLSSEYAQRNYEAVLSERLEDLEGSAKALEQGAKSLENIGLNEDGEIDPEKLGRAMGDFARAFEEAAKGAQESAEDDASK